MKNTIINDSIKIYLDLSKLNNTSRESKLINLSKAYDLTSELKDNNEKIKNLSNIIFGYFRLEDYDNYHLMNKELLELAMFEKDTLSIADYYWNKASYFGKVEVLDSAFFHFGKAQTLFERVDHKYFSAKMQYNMAYVLRRSKSYIASEVYAFKAISNLESLDKPLLLYRCYNHLGLLFNDLENLELSIQYHTKAMELLPLINRENIYLERSLNNLSLIYQKQGKYDLAITTLNKALENPNLREKNYNLYGKIIDNRSYCQFLKGDTLDVLKNYDKALEIRKELKNEAGIAISKLHLTEYFLKYKDTARAKASALEANDITSRLHLNRDILVSLNLLSKADPENAHIYMDRYITLNDSLMLEERKIRDKFTRIQFETEGYIQANEELKEQNIWISVSSILALASLSLLFFVYRQKSRNKTLVLERKQQDANEEIYNLMLKQQSRTEEGRIQERLRISEELHDGILAKLFSVRMGMGLLFLKNEKKGDFKHEVYMKELQTLEKEIRTLSHALKNDELSAKKDFPILLQGLLEEQSNLGCFVYQLDKDESIAWNLVEDQIKINLFRIAQESIHNILKYAHCTEVKISLEKKNNLVEMKIEDNGVGFDINKKKKGIGFKNMKSRVKSIGAMVNIISKPKQGTIIKITIPTKILYDEQKE